MKEKLEQLVVEALKELGTAKDMETFRNAEVKYLGRKGILAELFKTMGALSPDERKSAGQALNEAKIKLETEFAKKFDAFQKEELAKSLSKEFFDTTYPGIRPPVGSMHVLMQLQEEIEKIFSQMGFAVVDGPEIESEYYNFEGLNIPKDHPARDMQDTFFIEGKSDPKHSRLVLRTQTSPVQVRTMEKYGAPVRVIVPGRVFRNESTDASHEHTFNQVEGLLIDKDISIAHLKGVMTEFLSRLFKKQVVVRFRPGYFPFVEPGIELDFSCLLCEGKGCRVCKNSGWIEFMGAGMVHENVLKAGGIDSKEYQGWAFGFGLERLAMMRYGVTDIRLFTSGDLRFIRQF